MSLAKALAAPTSSGKVALVGVPCGLGAGVRGTELAPAAARLSGLAAELSGLGHDVLDRGDVVAGPRLEGEAIAALGKHAGDIAGWVAAAHDATAAALSEGCRPVVIGGDHAIAMGSVSAAALHARRVGKRLMVLWVDAHADFNTPETSPSGNLHGMSVAFLTGHAGLSQLLPGRGFTPLRPQEIVILGARSIDREEKQEIADAGLGCIDMRAIDEFGVCALLRQALAGHDPAGTHLHVSFDMDVVDPAIAPGVGTPVSGGLTYREAHLAMELLFESGMVGSVDFVELNPMLDHAGRTARLMVDFAGSLFGRSISLAQGAKP